MTTAKETPEDKKIAVPEGSLSARQRLLAQVAGAVAGGVMTAPSKSTQSASAVAAIAVDVAEAILEKIGI